MLFLTSAVVGKGCQKGNIKEKIPIILLSAKKRLSTQKNEISENISTITLSWMCDDVQLQTFHKQNFS